MKILMLLEGKIPSDTRVENEMIALTESGHDVHILCIGTPNKKGPEFFRKSKIHHINLSKFQKKLGALSLNIPLYFNLWRKEVLKLMKDQHFDAIHVHDLQLAMIGYEIKQKFKIPFILDLHENWPVLLDLSEHTKTPLGKMIFSLKKWKKYEKKYVNLADEIIVVVEESKDRIESLGVDRKKIHIVSNTLNLEENQSDLGPKENSKIIFSYVGGITKHRGLQYVIDAAKKVENNNFEIWIIGDGRYLPKLKDQVIRQSLSEKVKFLGWQNRAQLLKSMNESDITLIPHVKSGHTDSTIPHKLFQYMYAEKPILASNCLPIERIIKETQSGFIYEYSNVDQLASIMEKIISKEYPLAEYCKGKNFVIEKYNWNVDKLNLTKIYHD